MVCDEFLAAPGVRFELTTCGLTVRCSAVELEARRPGRVAADTDAARQPPGTSVWGDRGDLNPRPPGPQPGALTELSYAHHGTRQSATAPFDRHNLLPERAAAGGLLQKGWYENDGDLDALRGHPRFQALLERM